MIVSNSMKDIVKFTKSVVPWEAVMKIVPSLATAECSDQWIFSWAYRSAEWNFVGPIFSYTWRNYFMNFSLPVITAVSKHM